MCASLGVLRGFSLQYHFCAKEFIRIPRFELDILFKCAATFRLRSKVELFMTRT